jgi:hypothetical protein
MYVHPFLPNCRQVPRIFQRVPVNPGNLLTTGQSGVLFAILNNVYSRRAIS